ncbi:LacI family DNA-binding transcriptional regulator [Mycoplasmatota bacterium]|nr:LacI family DNA-binding transcriptional regulator [Mycoplasmatota bacterium]
MKIREIAKIANVSPATVSLVINGKKGVGEATRKRILSIIDDFGYEVTSNVSRKENKIFGNIKVICFNKYGDSLQGIVEIYKKFLDELTREANKLGLAVDISIVNEKNFSDFFEEVRNLDYHGIIFIATEMNRQDVELISDLNIPCVILDNPIENICIDSVSTDNSNMMFNMTKELFEFGYREIGYIRSTIQLENYKARYNGYMNAIKRFGLSTSRENVIYVKPSFAGAKSELIKYIQSDRKLPKALIVDNNMVYAALINAFNTLKIDSSEFVLIVVNNDITNQVLGNRAWIMDVLPETMAYHAIKRIYEKIIYLDGNKIKHLINPKLIKFSSEI